MLSRRVPTLGALLLLLLAARPAFAVKEWWEYYQQATEEQINSGHCTEAIKNLKEAIRLKSASAMNEQTYGLQFIQYFPYYYLGLCSFRTGDINGALTMINLEEEHGAIRKSPLYKDLLRLKSDVQNAKIQRLARLAREEVERLLREATDLTQRKRYDEALERIEEAKARAGSLDAATQQRVADLSEKVQGEKRQSIQLAQAQKTLEDALADGRKLLDDGKSTEAAMRFDQALAIDPHNLAAIDGKRDAQERLLASQSREALRQKYESGKQLFEAGKYEDARKDLTEAAADERNLQARDLLAQDLKLVEGVQRAKQQHARIDALLSEAERLVAQRKYAAASVKLNEVLDVDPANVKAQERQGFSERMTVQAFLEKNLPNLAPEIYVWQPQPSQAPIDVEGPSVQVIGVATDDRGVAKLEFRLGGALAGAPLVPPPPMEASASVRTLPFQREFHLEPGPNEIVVTVWDESGLTGATTLRFNRKLRWWETRAFLPSALLMSLMLVSGGVALQRARRRRAVRRRFNPYIAGAPVMSDDMFFGRAKLLARMLNVLHHNSLMITGERRIGKTTFLYHLKKALETDAGSEYRFFPVFTDLQGVPEATFFHAVMSDVFDALRLLPETSQALRYRPDAKTYDGRDFSHDLQRVIEELKTRTEKRVKLALLIDEVDALNEYSERINQRLRSIFMKTFSEHLVAIMSGVGIKRAWKSEGSPWYNFFDEIELTAFTREEAEALIRTPVEGYFRYETEAVESILAWSEFKPYVIQKFCIHAVNRMLEDRRTVITAADVRAVREMVRFDEGWLDGKPAPQGEGTPAGVVAD